MLAIRPWKLSDAQFIISIRNQPQLMRWFRQSEPIKLANQLKFMKTHPDYHGYIILQGRKRVGVVANHKEELCIAAPFKFHAAAIRLLEYTERPKRLFGDVLVGNPMLSEYLKAGFKIQSVRIVK